MTLHTEKGLIAFMALLSQGVKNITLGIRLPAFVSPNALILSVQEFNIRKNTTVEEDLPLLVPGMRD